MRTKAEMEAPSLNYTRLSAGYLIDMRRRAIWAEADALGIPAFMTPLWRMFYAKG